MSDQTPDSNENPKIPSFKPTRKSDEQKGGGGPLSNLGKSSSPTSGGGGGSLSSLGKSGGGTSAPSTGGTSGFKFPGFGASKKGAPGMKIRGMGGAGGSIMDRLKNLRRKDLMFIGAGLATLMMAPVAEHFMMSPEEGAGTTLEEGFDSKGPLFPDGSTVYESGTGGFSPGGLVGAGTDVITPLNVRDPSALVMGPGAKQKPEAVVAPPPAAASSSSDDASASKWKDALAESAKSGVREAVKKSPKLPRPSVKMQGALRGLSALSGSSKGGGASFKLPGLSASNVPNRARGSNSLTRSQAAPGFRGAARRSNTSGSGIEGLRGAGSRQADQFGNAGASNGLQTAANVGLPFPGGGGRGGFAGPGGPGGGGKNPGGNQIKENKQLGESLAFLRKKMEQEKAIALKWKKKEWKQFGRQKAIEEGAIKLMFDAFGKIIVDPISEGMKKLGGQIFEPPPSGGATHFKCATSGAIHAIGGSHKCISGNAFLMGPDNKWIKDDACGVCTPISDASAGPGDGSHQRSPAEIEEERRRRTGGHHQDSQDPTRTAMGDIFQMCKKLREFETTTRTVKDPATGKETNVAGEFVRSRPSMYKALGPLISAQMHMNSNKGSGRACLDAMGTDYKATDHLKAAQLGNMDSNNFVKQHNGILDNLDGSKGEVSSRKDKMVEILDGGVDVINTTAGAVDGAASATPADKAANKAQITAIGTASKGKDPALDQLGADLETKLGEVRTKNHGLGADTEGADKPATLDDLKGRITKNKERHEKIHEALRNVGDLVASPVQATPATQAKGLVEFVNDFNKAVGQSQAKLKSQYNGLLGSSDGMRKVHDQATESVGVLDTALTEAASQGNTLSFTAVEPTVKALDTKLALEDPAGYWTKEVEAVAPNPAAIPPVVGVEGKKSEFKPEVWTEDTAKVSKAITEQVKVIDPKGEAASKIVQSVDTALEKVAVPNQAAEH